jgi:polyribonucleotide nucleotidyltransferase
MSTTATGQIASVSVDVGGQEIVFETGKLAKQADGAVVVRSGETMILATAVGRPDARPDADFFPLTIDVEEKMYAAGKIPGGFFKREGPRHRAGDAHRADDRPPDPAAVAEGLPQRSAGHLHRLSADLVTPHDILCINGASAALMISPLPFLGPIGAVRVGRVDDEFVLNPTLEQLEESTLDLIVVGTSEALTMVEAGGDQIPEDTILEALELAHAEIRKICEVLEGLREQVGKAKWVDVDLTAELEAAHGDAVRTAIAGHGIKEAGTVVEQLVESLSPAVSLASTEEDLDEADTDPRELRRDPREGAPVGRRGAAPRAVPLGPPRAHGRRAGLEGAQVGEARPPPEPDSRGPRAAVPNRFRAGRGRAGR